MPRVLLDFTGAAGPGIRHALEDPIRVITAAALDEVRPALAAIQDAVADGLTAAGFLTYEAAPAFEPHMRVRSGGRMPLLWFGLFEDEGATLPADPDPQGPGAAEADLAWVAASDRAGHAAAVARVREEIAAGRTYQVNLTTRLRAPFTGDARALWDRMRRAQGPGFHAYLEIGGFAIASASPELFFATRGREIVTRPMKGTRPRGRWPTEDRAIREQLASSAKDRAENLMITDLLRNDLGRVAATGSVRVPRLLDIERYRTVWQTTSTVTATLRDDAGLTDVLAALFPCGSVTGAPKISTMEIIADLEPSPREVYCGAIGIVRPGGEATFSVPIRTAWIDRTVGQAEYGVGGGVVWDSTADAEYDELLAKALVVRAPWPRFSLLETLRLSQGVLIRQRRHLDRLRASADHFGLPFPEDNLGAALDAIRREHPEGEHRVRLEVNGAGRVEAAASPLEGPWGTERPVGDAAAAPMPVCFADAPVDSDDPFLYHKTTHRATYQRALAAAPDDAWDVVLVNERGEVTELTRGNIVVERDGELLTPPLEAGLLPGCLRAELLEVGVIREARLTPREVETATRTWLINSLRGWVPIQLRRGPPPEPRA